MARGDKDPLPIYQSRPPEWLPKSHNSAELGYFGFYPPRPDQEEEILTETNVKNGLMLGVAVPAEHFSAQETAHSCINSENALSDLEDLMNQIYARRMENVPSVPSSTFRLPSRVTLNETKRETWFADLANPDVPLHKLGKSVPHGAKGQDLLDLMHTNNVAIPRAVWFLRVFGGNETAGLRNKPNYNPTQYSVEWANVVTGYLKKQLTDIALPMAPRPGFNIKQTFKGVLSDPELRERWISRFSYCLSLLKSFYSEGMVDNRTFLAWLVQQTAVCNLAQLGFVARLADEYLSGMLVCRALARPFVEASLNRLVEIRCSSAREYLNNTEKLLENLLMRTFLAIPSAFVNPRMWIQHSRVFAEVVSRHIEDGPLGNQAEINTRALRQTLSDIFADVNIRNEAMLFGDLPPRVRGSLSSALADIKRLNSLSGKTDLETVQFFDEIADDPISFANKLSILFIWSVTPLQYGDHRPYAAAGLLRCWRDKAVERAIRRDIESPDDFIQDQLFDWLDSCEVAAEPDNLQRVAWLFGLLVHRGLFSYEKYILRLIARGESGLSFTEEDGSRHRNYLRHIPLHSSSASLISQRKVTLYGVRARETPEDVNERAIRKEIRSLLPELFGGEPLPISSFTDGLEHSCSALYSAPRYEQVRIVHGWLLPLLKKYITSADPKSYGIENNSQKAYCISTVLMAHCKCYSAILDLTLYTVERTANADLLTAIVETLRQHIEVWACLNSLKSTTNVLFRAHQFLKAQGVQNRDLLNLLIEMDDGRFLEPAAREHILADKLAYTQALHPADEMPQMVPAALPEILLLATDPLAEAPSALANSLWYKYRTSDDWAWKVWDNTVASLRQIPFMIMDVVGRRSCALRYALFLVQIDRHLPSGLNGQILNWLVGSGKNEIVALTPEAWDVFTVVLLYLSIEGALSTTTILEGIIYPVWHIGATVSSSSQVHSFEALLSAVNDLCSQLLLNNQCGTGYPPATFFEARGLRTRRRDVYREPHFARLVENIPTLVLVEQNKSISEALRKNAMELREALCQTRVFRQGVYRDLDTVHHSFQKILSNQDVPDELQESLINALRLMLNEGAEQNGGHGWPNLNAFLSPWKLAATSIEMRFTIRQLDAGLGRDATRAKSMAYLEKLTEAVYQQGIGSEEGDFVAEMLRDVSSPIAAKFVNSGLKRITEITADPRSSNATDNSYFVSTAGEILRLLANIVRPLRESGSMPELDESIQDKLMITLQDKFLAILNVLSDGTRDVNLSQMSQSTIFVARLLQFVLGFPGAWTNKVKQMCEGICGSIIKLVMLYGSGRSLNQLTFPLLLDTLYYILDELPTDPKSTIFDPFRLYPQISLQSLPCDMPPEYRQQIRSLLPFVPINAAVADLAFGTKDSTTGAWTYQVPVQNRPWEWTENIGDAEGRADDSAHLDDSQSHIKNSASLPLEMFGTKLTGEYIIKPYHDHSDESLNTGWNGAKDEELDRRVEGNLKTMQDTLVSESIFARDWREARVALDDIAAIGSSSGSSQDLKGEMEDDVGPLPNINTVGGGMGSGERRSRRGSPASTSTVSIRSKVSVNQHPPSGAVGMRHSPLFNRFSAGATGSGSTIGDAIDVDSLEIPTSSTSKRKIEGDDSEVEIIEGPAPKKTRRGAAASKTMRGRKRGG
ncbi:Mediator of RNA polymerase II transcription subunit 12 [Abortiporus biennis]